MLNNTNNEIFKRIVIENKMNNKNNNIIVNSSSKTEEDDEWDNKFNLIPNINDVYVNYSFIGCRLFSKLLYSKSNKQGRLNLYFAYQSNQGFLFNSSFTISETINDNGYNTLLNGSILMNEIYFDFNLYTVIDKNGNNIIYNIPIISNKLTNININKDIINKFTIIETDTNKDNIINNGYQIVDNGITYYLYYSHQTMS